MKKSILEADTEAAPGSASSGEEEKKVVVKVNDPNCTEAEANDTVQTLKLHDASEDKKGLLGTDSTVDPHRPSSGLPKKRKRTSKNIFPLRIIKAEELG